MRDFDDILNKIEPYRIINDYFRIIVEINLELNKSENDRAYQICLILILILCIRLQYKKTFNPNICLMHNDLCDMIAFQDAENKIRVKGYLSNHRRTRNVISITKNNESIFFKNVRVNRDHLKFIYQYLEEIYNTKPLVQY